MNCDKHGEQATICRFCDAETIAQAQADCRHTFVMSFPRYFECVNCGKSVYANERPSGGKHAD